MTDRCAWILATLAVVALVLTAPIWGMPYLVFILLKPMIVDMKKVIDGKMKFW